MVDDPMLFTAKACVEVLNLVPSQHFAAEFIRLKEAFFRKYHDGLICSTVHGIDFFTNVVACCEGRLEWDEKGEYGNNFRRLIATRPPWKTL